MYGAGPFGEASGRPVPVSVETFHALRERQTGEGVADPGTRGARSTCSTGTARGARGPVPTRRTRAGLVDDRPVDTAVVCQAASLLLQYPDARTRAAYRRCGAAGRRPSAAGPAPQLAVAQWTALAAMPPGALREHYVATFDRRAAAAST